MTASIIGFSILAIIGIIMIIYGFYYNNKVDRIITWPQVNGSILTKTFQTNTVLDTTTIMLQVTYQYTINNVKYQSNTICYGSSGPYLRCNVQSIINSQNGSPIKVFYNPQNPSESYLMTGTKTYISIFWGFVFLLIALYFLYNDYSAKSTSEAVTIEHAGGSIGAITARKFNGARYFW